MFLEEDMSTEKKQSKLHLYMENPFFSSLWRKMICKIFSKNLLNSKVQSAPIFPSFLKLLMPKRYSRHLDI